MYEVQEAVEDLRSGKPERQGRAHEALLRLAADAERRQQLTSLLEPLVENKDPQARGTALIVLAVARAEGVLERLRAHVLDPDPGFRCDLAHAASLFGPEARAVLAEMLQDRIFEVRFEAAVGLAEQGDSAGVPALLEGLDVSATRLQAFSSLQLVADDRVREPARRWFRKFFASGFDRIAAAGVLARLGDEEARTFLVDRIRRRKGDDRGLAIELAGELRLAEAGEPLKTIMNDRADPFRGAAARALGMIGDLGVMPAFAEMLGNEAEDADARLDAAEGLMHLGTPEARRALEAALGTIRNEEVLQGVRETLLALERERLA